MIRPNYGMKHVHRLIQEYSALVASADTTHTALRFLVEMADLNRAVALLPREQREVVFYHGFARLNQEETAAVLQKSQRWVSKTYRLALDDVHFYINGLEEELP